MKPSQLFILAIILLLPITVVALAAGFGAPPPAPRDGPWMLPLAERRQALFPRTFTNSLNETVSVAAPPQRIVSATIFSDAVLLDACPPGRIGALHDLSQDSRFSPVAEQSRRFPRHTTGDPEDILAADPDLVIVSSFSRRETVQLVSGAGRVVVRFASFDSIDNIRNNLRALGWVTGLDAEVERLVDDMDARLQAVARGREQRRAWRVLHFEDGHASGARTTFGSLLTWVGAHNVADDLGIEAFGRVDIEDLLRTEPDVLVVGAPAAHEAAKRAQLLQIPGFARLQAVRAQRLLFVDSSLLQSTSHHVAAAAECIAARLDEWR